MPIPLTVDGDMMPGTFWPGFRRVEAQPTPIWRRTPAVVDAASAAAEVGSVANFIAAAA
jgi:hypothetical protein